MKYYKIIRSLSYFLLALIFFIILLFLIPCPTQKVFYKGKDKIWAHRGLSIHTSENSIESINAAYDAGFKGAEIDIRYSGKTNSIYLSHDSIKSFHSLITLDSVIKNTPEKIMLWLDFKNLDEKNVIKTKRKLDSLKIKNRIIIESRNAKALNILSHKGYYTSFWLKDPYSGNLIRFFYNNIINKLTLLIYNNFNAISFDSKYINSITLYIYRHCNIHTWKIYTKDPKSLNTLRKIPSIKIILFDGKMPEE